MRKLLYVLLVIMLSVFSCKNNSQLNSEHKELLQIQERQNNKIQQLNNQKEEFLSQISISKSEIKSIIGNTSQSYSQVSNNIEIENKLKLIQRRLAYANKLDEFKDQTFQALQITNFTIEDIKDKIALGNILGEDELKQILADIDKIKKTSLPETENLALNIQNSELESYEDIWNKIILNDDLFTSKFKSPNINEEQINYQDKDKVLSENFDTKKKKMNGTLFKNITGKEIPKELIWWVSGIFLVLFLLAYWKTDYLIDSSFWLLRNMIWILLLLFFAVLFYFDFFY